MEGGWRSSPHRELWRGSVDCNLSKVPYGVRTSSPLPKTTFRYFIIELYFERRRSYFENPALTVYGPPSSGRKGRSRLNIKKGGTSLFSGVLVCILHRPTNKRDTRKLLCTMAQEEPLPTLCHRERIYRKRDCLLRQHANKTCEQRANLQPAAR